MNREQAKEQLLGLLDRPIAPAQPLPPAGSEIVIYGAGKCGRDVLRVLRQHGYQVAAFLDARAGAIGAVETVACVTPESEAARAYARAGVPVVVGVFNHAVDTSPIFALLQGAGYVRIISYHELFAFYPQDLASRYWLAPRHFYRQRRADILAGFELWADDESRRLYVENLELRLTWNHLRLRTPDWGHPYFPPDLPAPGQPLRFVDGGAYTGDSLQDMLQRGLAFESVAAFEPDPVNFQTLCQFARQHRGQLGSMVLLPCGLGEGTSLCTFAAGQGAGSSLAQGGDSYIQVVALDEVLPSFAPNLIKLDVEGAELAALRGAAETIRTHQPRLAVSAYHEPDHLWSVPLLLRALLPSHALSLRYHQFNGFDTVAYAYPRSRSDVAS